MGNIKKLFDWLEELQELENDENKLLNIKTEPFEVIYNDNWVDKIRDVIRKIRKFDITEIGDLYLTSGGRIVLDQGYGEYFNEYDTKLFTLKELTTGVKYKDFMKKITMNGRKKARK